MKDLHLNLFYSYNRDNELIENNLTRALIVFLQIVSNELRNSILHKFLRNNIDIFNADFKQAHFALQGNIDESIPVNANKKIILLISSSPQSTYKGEVRGKSIPDAWIYSLGTSYCIMIEAKIVSNPLDQTQLNRHSNNWYGIDFETMKLGNTVISISWRKVLETLQDTYFDSEVVDWDCGTDRNIMKHFTDFLSMYGYRVFKGFDFSQLRKSPLSLLSSTSIPKHTKIEYLFNFKNLNYAPAIQLLTKTRSK